MAATTDETSKPGKALFQTELWVLAAVAGVALVCVSLLAVALAMILGKGSLIQVNPVFNGGPGVPPAAAVPAAPLAAAAPPSGYLPNRTGSIPAVSSVLPGAPSTVVAPPAVERGAQGERPADVPSFGQDSSAPSAFFRVRGDAAGYAAGNQPLPMPVRHVHGAPSAPVPAARAPYPTFAADLGPRVSAPPDASAAPASGPAASGGAGAYARAACRGASVAVRLLGARSTVSLAGFSASPGNLFFTARILMVNLGAKALVVDSDSFDLRDADGDSYMAVPVAAAALPAGAKAPMTVTFVVPDDAALRSLALVLPAETDLLPLSKQ